ncbi:hypothetical protein PR048_021562 [Dryococelus australis]|uniref:Uncharacterized protein n=1 Tax=Dryococelus australis TaxID=614101 RepID=A0ABQ9GYJ7_9NEOP|nr:hypothetical protein PR048_021562 [Dryococelus australis]
MVVSLTWAFTKFSDWPREPPGPDLASHWHVAKGSVFAGLPTLIDERRSNISLAVLCASILELCHVGWSIISRALAFWQRFVADKAASQITESSANGKERRLRLAHPSTFFVVFRNGSSSVVTDSQQSVVSVSRPSVGGHVLFSQSQTRNPKYGATVAERLDGSLPTKANRAQSPAGYSRIFASGNRVGRCRWSAGFLGDLPFHPLFHSGAAPYIASPSSALNTSMQRAAQLKWNLKKDDTPCPMFARRLARALVARRATLVHEVRAFICNSATCIARNPLIVRTGRRDVRDTELVCFRPAAPRCVTQHGTGESGAASPLGEMSRLSRAGGFLHSHELPFSAQASLQHYLILCLVPRSTRGYKRRLPGNLFPCRDGKEKMKTAKLVTESSEAASRLDITHDGTHFPSAGNWRLTEVLSLVVCFLFVRKLDPTSRDPFVSLLACRCTMMRIATEKSGHNEARSRGFHKSGKPGKRENVREFQTSQPNREAEDVARNREESHIASKRPATTFVMLVALREDGEGAGQCRGALRHTRRSLRCMAAWARVCRHTRRRNCTDCCFVDRKAPSSLLRARPQKKKRFGRLLTSRSSEPMRVLEVSMEQRRNERAEETARAWLATPSQRRRRLAGPCAPADIRDFVFPSNAAQLRTDVIGDVASCSEKRGNEEGVSDGLYHRRREDVDRSRWLRTTNLHVPTLNCFSANTSSENGVLWILVYGLYCSKERTLAFAWSDPGKSLETEDRVAGPGLKPSSSLNASHKFKHCAIPLGQSSSEGSPPLRHLARYGGNVRLS